MTRPQVIVRDALGGKIDAWEVKEVTRKDLESLLVFLRQLHPDKLYDTSEVDELLEEKDNVWHDLPVIQHDMTPGAIDIRYIYWTVVSFYHNDSLFFQTVGYCPEDNIETDEEGVPVKMTVYLDSIAGYDHINAVFSWDGEAWTCADMPQAVLSAVIYETRAPDEEMPAIIVEDGYEVEVQNHSDTEYLPDGDIPF